MMLNVYSTDLTTNSLAEGYVVLTCEEYWNRLRCTDWKVTNSKVI